MPLILPVTIYSKGRKNSLAPCCSNARQFAVVLLDLDGTGYFLSALFLRKRQLEHAVLIPCGGLSRIHRIIKCKTAAERLHFVFLPQPSVIFFFLLFFLFVLK